MSGKRVREPKDAKDLVMGEVRGMLRKSSDGEKSGKSLDGQEGAVLETCQDYGLPIDKDFILRERAGLSGKLWWAGGGSTGIEGDDNGPRQTRPVLTKIVQDIVSGSCRCLVVWSLDRLARHVGIMESLLEILDKYGCLLYDRRGPVDLFTPEGRDRIRSNMTSAQYLRERAQVDAPRGVEHNKKKGKIVINANRLGFRAVGKASGEIIHKQDEQNLVFEIYHTFALGTPANATYKLGDAEHGPYSVHEVADLITNRPDVPWLDDVYPRLVLPNGMRTCYSDTLYSILRDPIYQGRQRHRGVETPCPIFLKADGEPVIPTWLYEAAQEKLATGSGSPGIKHNSYALTGLCRCGVCGIAMTASSKLVLQEDDTKLYTRVWFPKGRCGTTHCCPHKLPLLPIALLDDYLQVHLQPSLIAELQARNEMGEQVTLANERATILRSLADTEHRLNIELPRYIAKNLGKMDDVGVETRNILIQEIDDHKTRLASIERTLRSNSKLVEGLQALQTLPVSAKRDVFRAVIRWIAVIPSDPLRVRRRSPNGTRQPKGKQSPLQLPKDDGRLVILTAWGTLHSAVIYRDASPHHHMPTIHLRPAEPFEMVSMVSDLPSFSDFLAGIEHSHVATRRPFCREDYAPAALLSGDDNIAMFDVGIEPTRTDDAIGIHHSTERICYDEG